MNHAIAFVEHTVRGATFRFADCLVRVTPAAEIYLATGPAAQPAQTITLLEGNLGDQALLRAARYMEAARLAANQTHVPIAPVRLDNDVWRAGPAANPAPPYTHCGKCGGELAVIWPSRRELTGVGDSEALRRIERITVRCQSCSLWAIRPWYALGALP